VLSRIPYHNNDDAEKGREATLLTTIRDQYFSKLDANQFKYFGIIHHEREQGWKEEHRLGLPQEKQDFLTLDYLQLFESLFSNIIKKEKIRKEKLVAELLEKAGSEKSGPVKISFYTEALAVDQRNLVALLNRALELRKLKKWESAIEDVVTATKIHPYESICYSVHSIILFDFGREKKSVKTFKKAQIKAQEAINIDPDSYIANHVLGVISIFLAENKSNTEAETLYTQGIEKLNHAINIEPDNPNAYTSLAAGLLKFGKTKTGQESQKIFDLAFEKITMGIERGGDRYNLACFYALKGERKRALYILEEVLSKGKTTSDNVREDDDWLAMKDDPDFIQLLEKYGNSSSN
jgi:tetratricopeptide (TPR) repeat protein